MELRFLYRIVAVLIYFIARSSLDARAAGTGSTLYAAVKAGVASYDAMTGHQLSFLPVRNAYGVGVDSSDNVYVGVASADPASFVVNVYAPGNSHPSIVLNTLQQIATFAVSPAGEVAVAGAGAGSCCQNDLEFFGPGQTKPSVVIPASKAFHGFAFVAFDAAGNCWVDGYGAQNRVAFGYVAAGDTKIQIVSFSGATEPGALTVDMAGKIVVAESGVLHAFTAQGRPAYTVRLMGHPSTITGTVLSPDNTRLYVANSDLRIEGFRYPAGGRPALVTGTYASGIAVGN